MTDTDFFAIGAEVLVSLVIGKDVTGEVMAFDQKARILILKQTATNKRPTACDMVAISMSKVKNVTVITECDTDATPPPLPNIDLAQLRKRFDKSLAGRMIIHNAMNNQAPENAKAIYLKFAHCSLPVEWNENLELIVMNDVLLVPPYAPSCVVPYYPNNVMVDPPPKPMSLDYIRKMVEKFYTASKLTPPEVPPPQLQRIQHTLQLHQQHLLKVQQQQQQPQQ